LQGLSLGLNIGDILGENQGNLRKLKIEKVLVLS